MPLTDVLPARPTATGERPAPAASGRPFRVLFDCHTFDREAQGTTSYVAGVLNALPAAARRALPGRELEIHCAAESEANVRRHIEVPFRFVPIRSGFLRRNLVDIPAELRRRRIDLVVSQYVRPFVSPCPSLSVVHDVLFLDFPKQFSWRYRESRRLFFGWSARRSTHVATVSRYSAQRIGHHFGMPESAILLTPNAVDPRLTADWPGPRAVRAPGPLRLLSVSRLEARKRHEWCIEALDDLAAAGIEAELTIVGGGTGDYADRLRAMVTEPAAGGPRRVLHREGLSRAELAAEYARTDVFLFPSQAEGFGIPVIEAAAFGIPCVVAAGTALEELAKHFVGRTFAPDSQEDFRRQLRAVCADLDRLSEEAAEMRHGITEFFSWDTAAAAVARVVASEAARKP